MLTLATVSDAYHVPVVDFRRPGEWLLISSGAGIMSGVMDVATRFRWCLDIDEAKECRLADWLLWADRLLGGRIALVGWFSLTDPAPLRAALKGLSRPILAYTPFVELGQRHCGSLAEFFQRLDDVGAGRVKPETADDGHVADLADVCEHP